MNKAWVWAVAVATVLAVGRADAQKAEVGQAAPGFTLTSVSGESHSLADFKGKFVVLEWVNYDCPFIVKHYREGHMQALQKKYAEKDVVWLSICSSAPGKQGHFTTEVWKQRMAAWTVAAKAVLLDPAGTVGRAYDARTTPHMYIINPEGALIYAGGIDDKRSARTEDIAGAKNFVVAALDQALAGQPVEVATSQPYGCTVKY